MITKMTRFIVMFCLLVYFFLAFFLTLTKMLQKQKKNTSGTGRRKGFYFTRDATKYEGGSVRYYVSLCGKVHGRIPDLFGFVPLILSIVFTLSLMHSFTKPLLVISFYHNFFKICLIYGW